MTVHKFDIINLSETCLDSSTPFDDENLETSGYNLIRSDHPSNNKWGMFIYLLQKFSLRVCDLSLLDEYISFELKIGHKFYRFVQDIFCHFHRTLN